MAKKSSDKPLIKNPDEAAKALQVLFATDYVNKRKLYLENFLRGIFFSLGGLIGVTVAVTLLVWILSLFDTVPVIGPLVEDTKQTIKQEKPEK